MERAYLVHLAKRYMQGDMLGPCLIKRVIHVWSLLRAPAPEGKMQSRFHRNVGKHQELKDFNEKLSHKDRNRDTKMESLYYWHIYLGAWHAIANYRSKWL